jgi:hypothetical protein
MKEFSFDDIRAVSICVRIQPVTLSQTCRFAQKTWRIVGGDASEEATPLPGYMLIHLEPIETMTESE